jgi:hypothetical protein
MTKHVQKTKTKSISNQTQPHSLIPHFPPCKPIKPATIDITFSTKPLFIRTTEAVVYSIRTMEYALSPNGLLRQWLKLNCFIMVLLGIPAITITPVIVYLTSPIAVFSHELQNLFQACVPLSIIIAVITFIIVFIKR